MKLFQCLISVVILAFGLSQARAQTPTYFLVGEIKSFAELPRAKHDSYVLPLYKPEHIAYARYLVLANPFRSYTNNDNPIVVAWAIRDKDGINRNFLDPRFLEWSWHVEFIEFGQVVAEILDGWPGHTEYEFSHPQGIRDRKEIGYVAYTVVRELGPVPLYLSIIPDGQKLQFYWSGLGTNYLYTLENKSSSASSKWSGVPGTVWPRKTNHWTLIRPSASPRFYRVKAGQPQW